MALKVQGGSTAYLVNRWLAHQESWLIKKGKRVTERKGYEVQWKNIKSDCLGLIKNPVQLVPQIAYSLAAFWFILKGNHDAAKLLAFGSGIAADSFSSATKASGSGTTLTWSSHNVAGSNRLMLIGDGRIGGGAPTPVTYAGAAATKVSERIVQYGVSIWRKIAPATGVNDVVITKPDTEAAAGWEISFTGADQTQTGAATGAGDASTGTSLSYTVTTTVDNSMVVDYFLNGSSGTLTAGQGTKFDDLNAQGNRQGGHYVQKVTAGSQTMSWSWATSINNEATAIEVIEASGGGGGATNNWLLMGT